MPIFDWLSQIFNGLVGTTTNGEETRLVAETPVCPSAMSESHAPAWINLMAYSHVQTTNLPQAPSPNGGYIAPSESLVHGRVKTHGQISDGRAAEAQMAKSSREKSKHERRLLPTHDDVPSDALNLEPIRSYRDEEVHVVASLKKPQVVSSGFKPRNTLQTQPHAPKTTARNAQASECFAKARTIAQPRTQLAVTKDARNHSQTPDALRFDEHDERMAKRRKLEHTDTLGNTSVEFATSSIFDKSLAHHFGASTEPPVQKTRSSPTITLVDARRTLGKSNDRSISRKVDEYFALGTSKNRRKSRDSAHSSQPSTAVSPEIPPAHDASDRSKAGHSALVEGSINKKPVDDDIVIVSECRLTHNGVTPAQTYPPDIDIEAGPKQRLNDRFIRDEPAIAGQSQSRQSDDMKTTSDHFGNSHPRRSSTNSLDELATDRNSVVRHKARGERSHERGASEVDKVTNHEDIISSRSKTATQTKKSGEDNNESSARTRAKNQSSAINEASNAPNRISVNCVLCRACCIDSGKTFLVWDSSASAFHIEWNGELQRVPTRDMLIELGKNEIMRLAYAQDHPGVFIKGSASAISNGKILIEFSTHSDRQSFWFLVHSAYANHLQDQPSEPSKINGIFKFQGQEIKADHEKASQRHTNNKSEDVTLLANRKRRREADTDDEDRIKYECDDEIAQVRSSKRSQTVLDRDAALSSGSPRKSIYFDDFDRALRQSSRPSKPIATRSSPPPQLFTRWTYENKLERWRHPVVYPEEGAMRRVTVDFDDIERLDEGEFLNDSLIGFALRQIEEKMSAKHRAKVHFFNSFFFDALTMKNGKKGFYYDAVSRWTKNKDLFSLPYTVVPINSNAHWFLVIICNLNRLPRKPAEIDLGRDEDVEMLDDVQHAAIDHSQILLSDKTDVDSRAPIDDSGAILDSSPGFDNTSPCPAPRLNQENSRTADVFTTRLSDPTSAANSKKGKKKAPPPARKYDPNGPTIITLDSLGGSHPSETRVLKDYLNAEAESKRGMMVDPKDLQGLTAKGIPEQTNFCDCGVFLIRYIEEFAKDPRQFVTKVLQRELNQQIDFANFDPAAKRAEIRETLLELQAEQEAGQKAKKSAKKKSIVAQAAPVAFKADASLVPVETAETKETEDPTRRAKSPLTSHASKLKSVGISGLASPPRRGGREPEHLPLSVPRALQRDRFGDASVEGSSPEDESMGSIERAEEVADSQEAMLASAV